jgi:hypothetical protein
VAKVLGYFFPSINAYSHFYTQPLSRAISVLYHTFKTIQQLDAASIPYAEVVHKHLNKQFPGWHLSTSGCQISTYGTI